LARSISSNMLKIYITRHGQDEDNAKGILNGHRDAPLTQRGEQQAIELAENILKHGLKFSAVYTSPLLRVRQTAEIVAKNSNNPRPVVMQNLIERNFGVMTGELISSIPERCAPNILKAGQITYFTNAEGAETFPDLLERAGKVLAEVRQKHTAGSILLATHGDFGKMIYAAFYNLPWEKVLAQFHFGNSELLQLSQGFPPEEAHLFQFEQFNA
jgi:broad specificity phosphatase PhoE